ncbi:CsgG/HfaB family protein [bacterium]|nr:CsgG/HfaB family protein [bacterium]
MARQFVLLLAMMIAQLSYAAVTTPAPTAAPKVSAEGMTVAVFDFNGRDSSAAESGRLAAEMVRVKLGESGLRVVSREEMDKILDEHKLKIAGITDDAAPRTGLLLGAQIVVTGRVFDSNGMLIITAKTIGTETGRVHPLAVRGERAQTDQLGQELGTKIGKIIDERADTFVANVRLSGEQMSKLKKELAGGAMPRVFVSIREQVVGAPVPDPAAQTEFGFILRKVGAELVKGGGVMTAWIRNYSAEGGHAAPPPGTDADIAIIGEGVSQAATRTGELISSRARVEVEAIDMKTGKALAVDRETYSAVDVSEAIAAKSALQETAARLAYRMLPEAIGEWRKAHPAEKAPAAGAATTTGTLNAGKNSNNK